MTLSTAERVAEIAGYLDRCRGRANLDTLRVNFPGVDERFVTKHFVVEKMGSGVVLVSKPMSEERLKADLDALAYQVAKDLVRNGGSADLQQICGRNAISARQLLAHREDMFEVSDGQLHLAGAAKKIAEAAVKRTALALRGRAKRGELFTSRGDAVDPVIAAKLLRRIQALITSLGDGSLPVHEVYRAVGLQGGPPVRRWLKRSRLEFGKGGDLRIPPHQLSYFRIQRALAVSAFLVDSGGRQLMEVVMDRIYRPPEFVAANRTITGADDAPPQRLLEAGADPSAMPGGEAEGGEGEAGFTRPPGATMPPARGAPRWIAAWLRKYFAIEDGVVFFPMGPEPARPYSQKRGEPPLTYDEEVALQMNVEEEMRLRYYRAHESTIVGSFMKVRKPFLKRFYDITEHGDVIPKKMERQVHEAIAIARRTVEAPYTVERAFWDFGATRDWLKDYFEIDNDEVIHISRDIEKAWTPPPPKRSPNPYKYMKLDAPKGYARKRVKGKYMKRIWGRWAGGVLY